MLALPTITLSFLLLFALPIAPALAADTAPALRSSKSEVGTLTLEIRHLWRGQAVSVPAIDLPTASGDRIELTRLAYLLSKPRLALRANSNTPWIQRDDWFGYVDVTKGLTRLKLAGLPREKYSHLKFHVGLDEIADKSDPNQYPARHPLNPANNLHWSWQGSYIFLATEGRLHSTPMTSQPVAELAKSSDSPPTAPQPPDPLGFSYHLGNAHNLMTVRLPLKLDLTERDATLIIDFHLDRFLDQTDIAAQTSTHGREGDEGARALVTSIEDAFTHQQIRYPSPESLQPTENATPAVDFIGTPYQFKSRRYFPIPDLPTDYPLTEERIALGKKLFHDPILSSDGIVSCSLCHQSERAFTDFRVTSVGVDDQEGRRNSMQLFNLAWKKDSFFWDGRAPSLRKQALIPIEDPIEMHETLENVEAKLAAHEEYPTLFEAAFGEKTITAERLGIAIEQFVLTLTSFDSKFDRSQQGRATLTTEEQRGFELFFTEHDPRREQFGADCFHCHGGANFTDHGFHNNGLAPGDDHGLEEFTGNASDRHRFSTPSLRNIAITSPYMHDGRFSTLEEVLSHYTGGVQRSPTLDPNLAKHPGKGVPLSQEDQNAIIAFLRTLTDARYITP